MTTTTPLPPHVISTDHPNHPSEGWSIAEMVWIDARDKIFQAYATQARADLVAENQRLRGHLENLLCYDSYDQEYDGRMFAICPSCGGQEGEHTTQCEFEAARAALEKQP